MNRRKKRIISIVAGIAIIAIGAAAIASVIIYTFSNQEPEYFHPWRRNLAIKLYNEIMEYDLVNDYPETASEVIELNNKISHLIYGDMLLDNELLGELLLIQRALYADTLLESISYDDQYENLTAGLEKYKEYKTICYDITQELPQHPPDDEKTTLINVVWQTNNMGDVVWLYTLTENEKGQHKILRFETVE